MPAATATATDPGEDVDLGAGRDHREGVARILGRVLADEMLLYQRLRNYHWNVVGPNFHSIHVMLEQQYGFYAETVDTVAERIRSLGFHAPGTLTEFLELSRLGEKPGAYPDWKGMLEDLVADHETLIQSLREDIDECADKYHMEGAADLLTGLIQDHEKHAWMLRATVTDA